MSGTREWGGATRPTGGPVGNRWAVIVGISAYKDPKLKLDYAAADAQALFDLITTPAGGGFEPEKVRKLINEEATTAEVTRALRSFLTKPSADDLVLIYLACHGGPDPRRPSGRLYLLTHDTDPDDIMSSAVPMDEIQFSLSNSLDAKRVVIIADTCHSAAIAGGGLRGTTSAEATNQYLEQLSRTKHGTALLTSAEASESSREDARWGGGHGVFTHFLLEGMRGAADGFGGTTPDGIVGVGELFEYVRENVKRETDDEQHPAIGTTNFDRNLPMAVIGRLDLDQHLDLARALIDVGWILGDPAAFLAAANQAAVATDLARAGGQRFPPAEALRGEALLAAEDAAAAAEVLEAIASDEDVPAVSLLHLGIARAEVGDHEGAAAAFDDHVRLDPNGRDARWAEDYAGFLRSGRAGRGRALLIAAGTFEANIPPLQGPKNDVTLVKEFLVAKLGFRAADIRILRDKQSTRAGMLEALDRLASESKPSDTVVLYFSGHAARARSLDDVHLVAHDSTNEQLTGLTVRELHDRLMAIDAADRLAILDTDTAPRSQEMFERSGITVLAATGPDGQAYESIIGEKFYGAFTHALVTAWSRRDDSSVPTLGELLSATTEGIRASFPQTPLFIGNHGGPVLGPRFPNADLWRLTRLASFDGVEPESLKGRRAADFERFPELRWVLGRVLLARGEDDLAHDALVASTAGRAPEPRLWVDRAIAEVRRGDADEAATSARTAVTRSPAPGGALLAAQKAVDELRGARATALVVGVDRYRNPALARPEGAVADATAFGALLESAGIDAADIVVLTDDEATTSRITEEFDRLADRADDALAVFYFAGLGSWSAAGSRTILGTDARERDVADLSLADLASRSRAGGSERSGNLVCVFDAGWSRSTSFLAEAGGTKGARVAPMGETAPAVPGPPPPSLEEMAPGAVTIWTADRTDEGDPRTGPVVVERPSGKRGVRGVLTANLDRAIRKTGARSTLTYGAWAAAAGGSGRTAIPVEAVGPAAGERLLRHRTLAARALDALAAVERQPAAAAVGITERLINQVEVDGGECPHHHLHLGLARLAIGDTTGAIDSLRTARNLYDDRSVYESMERRDPSTPEWQRFARYHLGRLLYQHGGDLNDAVSTLRAAYRQAPDDARVCYHLGWAIQTLVNEQSLVEAVDLFRRYLDLGAPLGDMSRVQGVVTPPTTR